ncbi:MAG TPA: hypothetical protein VNL71_04605 [Chloroflexota bacterium]|nr:hypothetical protein [Chloroflexota bacterium]
MANYIGTARTNYFRVRDAAAFAAFLVKWGLAPLTGSGDQAGLVGCTPDSEHGGWPSEPTWAWQDAQEPPVECGEYDGPSLLDDLAALLADGEVAVAVEVGSEKLRYLVGDAWAVNGVGEKRSLSLDAIMDLARDLGPNVTEPEY